MMRFNTMCKCCRAYKNYTKKGINEKIYLIGFHIIIVERKEQPQPGQQLKI